MDEHEVGDAVEEHHEFQGDYVPKRKEPMARGKRARNAFKSTGLEVSKVEIAPRGDTQRAAFGSWEDEQHLVLNGAAGSGKTFVALALAMDSASHDGKRVIIVRSAVPSREIGFMPGDEKEKAAKYEDPYIGLFAELFGRGDAYEVLKASGTIEFTTTSFLRGITFRNAVVIIEEFQNMSFQELDTVITRVGEGSRVIVTGDFEQTDLLKDMEGAHTFFNILNTMESFSVHIFGIEDVQRSGLVKEYLNAKGKRTTPAFLRKD